MTKSKIELQRQSPGFRRMQERLGPDAAEKLRQDTMRLQEAAATSVRKPMTVHRGYNIRKEEGRYFRAYLDTKPTSFYGDTEEQVMKMIDRFKRSSSLK